MRIACVHVPQFALQTLTRIDPSLRGAPVAVVGTGSEGPTSTGVARALYSPVVQACSRAAWSLGIRLGMTATAANALAPGQLRVVTGDHQLERETVRAIADALLAVAGVVDVGGRVGAAGAHLAIYCEVPSKTRGTSYGDRLLEVLDALGLTARIGIADDRFAAWVAAAHGGTPSEERGVISVPRGGSAAFLSPRPLSLLAITPEVQHMLEALGVRTLGEFAALPAPSVSRPLEADYQALARGESGHSLRPYVPEAPIREELVISAAHSGASAVAVLAERVALRLAGRGRGAARLEITALGPDGEHVLPIGPVGPAASTGPAGSAAAPMASMRSAASASWGRVIETPEELAEAFGRALGEELSSAWRLRVAVLGEAVSGDATETTPIAPQAETIDALSVVLSSTGSAGSWRLTSDTPPSATLRSERRDAHRRTRRGKQHRRGRIAELPVQPWLFADRK
jgi:nucleotidyltransferase/DNA polymerase involved in DNA repair